LLPQQLLTSPDTHQWITDAKSGKMPPPNGPVDTPRHTGAPVSVAEPLKKCSCLVQTQQAISRERTKGSPGPKSHIPTT